MNSLPLVTFFLAHSASAHLRHTAYTSLTPLSIAASFASISIVTLLVSSGARVDRGNVLHAAVTSDQPGRLEIISYLISQGAPVNTLWNAHNRRRASIEDHLQGEDWVRGTPLHEAVKVGRKAVLALLLERGGDAEAKDVKGRSVKDVARMRGNKGILEILAIAKDAAQ